MDSATSHTSKLPANADVPCIPTYLFSVVAEALREQGKVNPCFINGCTDYSDDCLAPSEHLAWSSPIFVDFN